LPTIYNEDRKVIFVHVPKSAGSSVTIALRNESKLKSKDDIWLKGEELPQINEIIAQNDLLTGRKVPANHSRAMDVRKSIGARKFDEAYSFTFVRNPYDRVASTYHYIRRNPPHPMNAMALKITLEQFILYHSLVAPQIQSDWIFDREGKQLVKDIFRSEDMDNLGPQIGQHIFGNDIDFGRINTSKNNEIDKSTLFDGVSDWIIALFRTTYAADFALAGYGSDISAFRSRPVVENPDFPDGDGWQIVACQLAKSMAKLSHRNRFLEQKTVAEPLSE